MIHSITIIGCGWLGLPLAEELVANGYKVNGTTTTPAKMEGIKAVGAKPHIFNLSELAELHYSKACLDVDLIICAVPPTIGKNQDFPHNLQIDHLMEILPKATKVIYVSSTSIYPQHEGEYQESSNIYEDNTGNRTLLLAEKAVFAHSKNNSVLRLGGLLGYNRIAGKYFAGKTASGRLQPVNYIHRDDVIGIILEMINQNQVSGVFNLVTPIEATRNEVYTANSEKHGFQMCTWVDDGIQRKISSERLGVDLMYDFKYPNPLNFN